MMLTTKSRYAVMALVDMANQNRFIEACNKATCLHQIAERQGITVAYLEQIFCKLKAAQIVNSQRGPGGGYILARAASEINIAEIILAVDEPIKMTRCGTEKTSACNDKEINSCGEKEIRQTSKNLAPEKAGCRADKTKCNTHELWEGLENQIENYLKAITIDDVVNGRVVNGKALN
jgi:Rrf2 family transcriptional regulator, iron-sulfur cluster assembly transcription factor